LTRRPARQQDGDRENEALIELVRALARQQARADHDVERQEQ